MQKSGIVRPMTKGPQTTGQPTRIATGNRYRVYQAPKNPWGVAANYGAKK